MDKEGIILRAAAIDIGTNSCRLLIAEDSIQGRTILFRDLDTTRMGRGIGATGRLGDEAINRTIACLHHFQEVMNSYNVETFQVVGTSALREASNRQQFLERVMRECGMQVMVISGEEEAWLSYQGVCQGMDFAGINPLVVDLGGGSTELVWNNHELQMMSLPIGAVKAAETGMDYNKIMEVLKPLCSRVHIQPDVPLVFVGGTATSLVAVKLGLKEYRSELVHGQKLFKNEIESIYRRLSGMNLAERCRVPGLQEKRADIIVYGIGIVLGILDILGREEITISESDLLDAIISRIDGR